ncbi:MAG: hypothetical protein CL432_00680 [Acidimicrobiaceae bacterium]|nr:hypothetical protein [Acidimicrobiaceae bacterium]HJO40557.1 DUF3090 family protein [Acidimicrobiales bacterium]
MERPEINWEHTESFTAGTMGPQGRRVFFLQASFGNQVLSLKVEKQQMAGLAGFLTSMLNDLPPTDEPELSNSTVAETKFIEPEEPDWVIGNFEVIYKQSEDQLILIAEELIRDEASEPAQARLSLSRLQVEHFIQTAQELISSGRPPCPYCGSPLEPDAAGWCPCSN